LLALVFSFISLAVSGQVGVDYTLTKPAKYENRILASEKSNNGKKFSKKAGTSSRTPSPTIITGSTPTKN